MESSIKTRYLYKFFATIISLVIGLATQAIIPRGLGPKAFGDFNFLTNFFTQVVGFLDMGTSIGFYTKICQRQKEFALISFYTLFAAAASLAIIIFVAASASTSVHHILWPDQRALYIYLAAFWGILTFGTQILNKIGDAYALTVPVEKVRVAQKVVGLGAIFALFMSSRLNLTNFFFTTIWY